jgi:curved DNA-binding protein CbpA
MAIPDYYLILNIKRSASDEEIKQAFRRLAKKFHPDKNPGREKAAEQRFKKIIAAYKVLGNRKSRYIYDQKLRASRTSIKDSRRANLRRKAENDTTHLCQLLLFELLNKNAQSALEIYENLISKNSDFSLGRYMSDGDTRDCEFLLAEAYHQTGKLAEAARLYEKVLEQEKKKAYFHSFAQEIELMLKDVYLQRMTSAENSEEVLADMEKILAMNLSRREAAWVHKKAAEAYYRMNYIDNAIRVLRQAFQINPKLTGAKKISKKLGLKIGTPSQNLPPGKEGVEY